MFIKKVFRIFEPFLHVWLQSLKKNLYDLKKIIFEQIQKVSKMQNFTLISNPLKIFFKNVPKKSYWQKWDENLHFFHFYSRSSNLFCLILFFVNFLKTFSTDLKSAWNSAFFDTFFDCFHFFRSYLYFFQTLKPNA